MPAAPKKIAIWIMYGSGRRLLQSGLSRATGTVNVHPLVFSKVCHVDGKKGSLYRYLYRLRGPMLVMRLAIVRKQQCRAGRAASGTSTPCPC
ncbi:hypothetical protein GE21DRAFT_1290404 [Neurospora crassa]|nr:hypothetical protein GE21DRAFT_1290404 [Neurospora crassa]